MVFNMGIVEDLKNEQLKLNMKIYKQNEVDANKGLAKGCLFSSFIIIIVWILYIVGVFKVPDRTLRLVNIFFPILFVILLSSIIYTKTKLIERPAFKYFLLIQFILVTFGLNVILPKHGILMWATCIILANHYFSPKASLFTYLITTILMFIAIFMGMLLGEWDSNLLNGANTINVNGVEVLVDEATYQQRVAWLDQLKESGDNRFLKAFLYYYVPRWFILTIISFVCFSISRRSLRLLIEESSRVKEKQKMKSELNVAKSIQTSVLPKTLNDANKDNIFGLMIPAKEIGGDFYDYFYIDESHLALVIGDVSGKGIPAALFMMKTEALIKSLTLSFKRDTAHIMKGCNVALCSNNEANIFVTCWLGILNLYTGELKYTNAGHNKILIVKDGKAEYLNDKPNVVLGAFEECNYTENTINLKIGDKILLYTDGVTEAHNINNELYGEERLLNFSNKYKDLTPRDFVLNLRKSVANHSIDTEQFDDITILMYSFNYEINITESRIFEADVKELDNLFEYSSQLLRLLEFSNRDIIMINTALEEVFVNVANYAYDKEKEKGTVEITLSRHGDYVTFVFKDNGKPFNPLEKADPNITASSEEREIGGLGIYMVKKIMDEVDYEYVNNQNVLTLKKFKK
ncbi:MAG: SpoIIE family protein phosphatase [Acholeplasmatales bacterium]|nr:SpoIIE family protein phosphatase [Acholeplasmatales bacterium]